MKETWENLTQERRDFYNNIAENLKPIQILFIKLSKETRCIFCKTEFSEGLLKKSPGKNVPINAYTWFTPKFLVHLATTHGYQPEILTGFLGKINEG